ncbi:MAG: hypothetical protein COV36_08210 [Alphaproteobacteria bacterium CG11_big_fil_rev_8_21_14_0_20_44_7]|nr:MAG: hypothetical protein COV36_08210 [Alphaproteobacteria bacterium CG11_big_fil_rev_8_21_14_0_20_44_7]
MSIKFSWDVDIGATSSEGEIIYFGPREYITYIATDGRKLLLTHLFDYEDKHYVSGVWFPESRKWGENEEGEAISPEEEARIKEVITAFLTQDIDDEGEAAAEEVLWEPDGPVYD